MMDLVACAVALADLCVLVILCAWKLFTITLWMLVFSHKNIRKEKKTSSLSNIGWRVEVISLECTIYHRPRDSLKTGETGTC